MSIPQHILDRLEDYRDAQLDQSGQDVVLSWLRESESNEKELAKWFKTEVELFEAARLVGMRDVFEGLTFDSHDDDLRLPSRTPTVSAWRRPMNWLAVASTLLFVAAAVQVWKAQSLNRNRDFVSTNVAASEVSVPSPAILGRLANCVWAPGAKPIRVGQDVVAGTTLDIKSGLAQLVFESGAEVVLKGPCRIRVDGSMLCSLAFGSVSADVPPRAAGFTIRGPAAEVIDLGTRFGFSVGPAGTSEIHVFQGEVISRQLDESGQVVGDEIRLKKDQAILFPGERKEAQRLAANEAKFALEVRPLWRQDTIEPLVVDRNVAFWLRAAHGVQTDKNGRVVAWQDLSVAHNRIANDAFQPDAKSRPRLLDAGIGGRPTVRFNGLTAHLTTTPMTTTDDQSIVAVFQYLPPRAGERIGGQIVNYNGPPSRYLPDIQSPGVLQLGEKIRVADGPYMSVSAKAFVGKDARGTDVSAGVVVSESLGQLRPRVVAYTYNHSENAATLYVDGKQVSVATAPTRVAVTSRKVIGKHGIFDQWYFHGDLSELVIFNTALSQTEVGQLSRQLMDFYGMSTDDTPNL
jgi:hypothetical protein